MWHKAAATATVGFALLRQQAKHGKIYTNLVAASLPRVWPY